VVYDVMGRVRQTESFGPAMNNAPAGAVRVENDYDREGNLTKVARVMTPDPSNITVAPNGTRLMVHSYVYDRAHRRIVEVSPDEYGEYRDSTVYDPASNVVQTRGGGVTMTYDALNRMVRREVPAPEPGMLPEVNRFRYDEMGNLLSATNDDARVTRTYFPNRAIRTDSTKIRTDVRSHVDTLWTGYTAYRYGLQYEYDRNGRRTAVVYPANLLATTNLAGLRDRVRYGYDPETGALSWVEGFGADTRFDYRYDARGRPDTTYMPANITEWYTYDQESRRTHRHATAPAGGSWAGGLLRADTLAYDLRSKLLGGSGSVVGERVATSHSYDGLGNLIATGRVPTPYAREVWNIDPLGNRTYSEDWPTDAYTRRYEHTIEPGTGRLKRRMTPRFANDSLYAGDTIQYYYNWRGERTGLNDRSRPERNPNYNPFDPNQPEWLQRIVESISMYRSDGLMYEFRRLSTLQLGAQPRLKEKYAYDALGRRVWRRARVGYSLGDTLARDSICNRTVPSSECASVVERTIWDGDQVIADIRETIEYTPGWGRHYGRAIYAHAGGIDQPSEVVRLDGDADFVVIPHRNWQGAVDVVTFTGAKYTQCGPHNWQSWRNSCYPVELPIRSSYGEPPRNDYNAPDPGPASWMGSLMEGSRDFSGLMYRRNRYLDPASGQFTQVDPIGLAGGLNLYGYANGDPVSYSDPYGLAPSCEPFCTGLDVALLAADINDIRKNGLGWGNGIGVTLGVISTALPFVSGLGATDDAARGGARLLARGRWAPTAFRAGELDIHFAKHAAEWGAGNITKGGYLTRARQLLSSDVGGQIQGFTRRNGDVVRYNARTNEFAVAASDGTIRTLFRPTEGAVYYAGEAAKR
jgi:RHS repeat-associated protein